MKYVDPDGRAVVVYLKYCLFDDNENDKYVFRSQTYLEKTIFDKTQVEFYPIYGDEIVDLSYSLSGEHRIKEVNNETFVTDIALTTISISGDLKLTEGLEKVGKVVG